MKVKVAKSENAKNETEMKVKMARVTQMRQGFDVDRLPASLETSSKWVD